MESKAVGRWKDGPVVVALATGNNAGVAFESTNPEMLKLFGAMKKNTIDNNSQ
jgi:hypothetical protein